MKRPQKMREERGFWPLMVLLVIVVAIYLLLPQFLFAQNTQTPPPLFVQEDFIYNLATDSVAIIAGTDTTWHRVSGVTMGALHILNAIIMGGDSVVSLTGTNLSVDANGVLNASGSGLTYFTEGDLTDTSTLEATAPNTVMKFLDLSKFAGGINMLGQAINDASTITSSAGNRLLLSPNGSDTTYIGFSSTGEIVFGPTASGYTFVIKGDALEGVAGTEDILNIDSTDFDLYQDKSIGKEDIEQAGATNGQVLKWDGSDWSPADDDSTGGGGSGTSMWGPFDDTTGILKDTVADTTLFYAGYTANNPFYGPSMYFKSAWDDVGFTLATKDDGAFFWMDPADSSFNAGGVRAFFDMTGTQRFQYGATDSIYFQGTDAVISFKRLSANKSLIKAGAGDALTMRLDSLGSDTITAGFIEVVDDSSGTIKLFGATSGSASITVANVAGTPSELVLPTTDGSNTNVLTTDGAGVLSWAAAGAGDVTKVGTPVNDQVGVWTGDGTLEGDADLTFDGTNLTALGLLNTLVGFDGVGAIDLDYGSADITDHTFTTDGVGTAEIVLPAGAIDGTEVLDGTLADVDMGDDALDPDKLVGDVVDDNKVDSNLIPKVSQSLFSDSTGAGVANNFIMDTLGAPTFSTVQQMQNIFHSSGFTSGGAFTDTTDGAGDIDSLYIAAGTGLIRATDLDTDTNTILFFDWGDTTILIPADTVLFIGVKYNGGTPIVFDTTADKTLFDHQQNFELGTVTNEAGVLHITFNPHVVGDHATAMIDRTEGTMGIKRDNDIGGIILGETGTRNPTVSAGTLYSKLNTFVIAAIDLSSSGSMDRYYQAAGSGFTKEAAVTTWNNTQYDDGDGGLATIANNRYAIQWFYVELDGALISMYGRAQYTSLALAEAEVPPPTLPKRLTVNQALLIGRLIFQESSATASEIQTVFGTSFPATAAQVHTNLGSLSSDDHTQYLLRSQFPDSVVKVVEDSIATMSLDTVVVGVSPVKEAVFSAATTKPGYCFQEPDAHFGNAVEGMIQIGDALIAHGTRDTLYNSGLLDIGGTMVFRLKLAPDKWFEQVYFENNGAIRFVIPIAGAGFGTYNARSFFIAGPAVLNDSIVRVEYWGFTKIDANTGLTGADLGVQDDLEVMGIGYFDSLASITAAPIEILSDISVTGDITVTGTVDGVNVAARDVVLGQIIDDTTAWNDHIVDATQGHSDYMRNVGDTVTGTYDFSAGDLLDIDSSSIAKYEDNSVDMPDINWEREYIELTIVHGWDATATDSTTLFLSNREGYTPILFVDSTNVASKKDTVYVTGTTPYDCIIDSVYLTYKVTGASVLIDSLVFRGPDLSAFTNLCDSTYASDGTNLTSTSVVRLALPVAFGGHAASAGNRFGLLMAMDLAADDGTVKVYSVQLAVKR